MEKEYRYKCPKCDNEGSPGGTLMGFSEPANDYNTMQCGACRHSSGAWEGWYLDADGNRMYFPGPPKPRALITTPSGIILPYEE